MHIMPFPHSSPIYLYNSIRPGLMLLACFPISLSSSSDVLLYPIPRHLSVLFRLVALIRAIMPCMLIPLALTSKCLNAMLYFKKLARTRAPSSPMLFAHKFTESIWSLYSSIFITSGIVLMSMPSPITIKHVIEPLALIISEYIWIWVMEIGGSSKHRLRTSSFRQWTLPMFESSCESFTL